MENFLGVIFISSRYDVDVVSFYICIKIETSTVKILNKISITAFVDVSPEETAQKTPFESFKDVDESSSSKEARVTEEVSFLKYQFFVIRGVLNIQYPIMIIHDHLLKASQNGTPFNQGFGDSSGSQSTRK